MDIKIRFAKTKDEAARALDAAFAVLACPNYPGARDGAVFPFYTVGELRVYCVVKRKSGLTVEVTDANPPK